MVSLADCILNRMTNRERLDCMAGWLHLIRCVNIILFFLWIHFLGTFEKFDWYLIMVVLRPKNRKRDLAYFLLCDCDCIGSPTLDTTRSESYLWLRWVWKNKKMFG
jgi:hypothetical protein